MTSLRYVLFSPRYSSPNSYEFINLIYENWKNTFQQVLGEKGGQLHTDDFYRYDMIGVLLKNGEFVGSHFYSTFDLNLKCCTDHHFFQDINPLVLARLRSQGVKSLYSLEYTNVGDGFRKDQGDVRWSEVLTGCALQTLDTSKVDGIIGTPRTDIKANVTAMRLGAEEIQAPFKKMNYECSVIFWRKDPDRKLYNQNLQKLVQQSCYNLENLILPLNERIAS